MPLAHIGARPVPHRRRTMRVVKLNIAFTALYNVLGLSLAAFGILPPILAAAAQSKCSSLQLLERVLAVPANRRRERSIESRLKTAKFRDPATFESFDWEFNRQTIDRADFEELATGDFIRRRDNLAFVGESGLGKSHLIQSVGRRCCALGYRVRYITSAELLEDLSAASGDKTLASKVRYYRPSIC